MNQRDLAELAGTSQATLSAYERGKKIPSVNVAARIVEAAGFRLDLATRVTFAEHAATAERPFWVPDRLWRGKLPDCFATVTLREPAYRSGVKRFRLRSRPARRRMYEMLLCDGTPQELMDWVDGALLVDLWDELRLPPMIRAAWKPVIDLASADPYPIPIRYEALPEPDDDRPVPIIGPHGGFYGWY